MILAGISQFIIIFLLYQDFAFGFLRQEDGYSHLRKYLRSKPTKLAMELVEKYWIEQPLDHLDKSDNRTWKMKYFQNLKYFKVGGPIYLFIGGEGPQDGSYLTGGLMYELAMNTNGAMFASEHRYYGDSMPRDNKKLEDLKYLNSRQAIVDFVQLLMKLKIDQKFKSSKVVVIGGSYAGNLAAWGRLLFPGVIDAALASSAPVLAKYNFYEYLETVGDDYKKFGTPGCYDRITEIFKAFTDAFETPEGIERLKKEQNICETSDLSQKKNQYTFVYNYVDRYYMTQYATVDHIKKNCEVQNPGYYMHQNFSCENIDFDQDIQSIKSQGDSWFYQTCSEFSFAETTSSNKQPFGKIITLDVYIEQCNLIYGPNFNAQTIEKAVNKTNDFYGGLKPNVTKVVFTNGELDSWHRLGVLEDLNPDAPARLIPQMSHCTDLHGEAYSNSTDFVETVQFIKKTIKQWIGL